MEIAKLLYNAVLLQLVDDAGMWFSIWGGYAESPALSVKLLAISSTVFNIYQQVSAN